MTLVMGCSRIYEMPVVAQITSKTRALQANRLPKMQEGLSFLPKGFSRDRAVEPLDLRNVVEVEE